MRNLFGILVMMLLLIGTVSAQKFPMAINGQVVGFSGTLNMEVTNLRTTETMTAVTNSAGQWLVEWGNSVKGFTGNDQFRISIADCRDRVECSQTVTYTGQASIYALFDVTGIFNVIPPPEPEPVPTCPEDTTPYDAAACQNVVQCPAQPDCEVPEEGGSNWTSGLITGLIAALAGLVAGLGGGMKFYKNAAGSVTIQHRHKGILGFHDPNTLHSFPAYKHRRYKDNPLGCMQDVKKINEKGDVRL